jgi:hypothetical protein
VLESSFLFENLESEAMMVRAVEMGGGILYLLRWVR